MVRLASSSETRAKILKESKIEFIQSDIHFDEDILIEKYKHPRSFVYHATKGKLQAAIDKYGLDIPIVVADTVVSVNEKILRKAKDEKEALEILKLQSENIVSILTCTAFKSKNLEYLDLSATYYHFSKFDEKDLQNYIESGEWKGKAGACMVEGFCKKYIKSVKGFESCARGLTIEKLLPLIELNEDIKKNI
ncbi:septum formation inhibitor Maf [Nitrosophilus kaiyonis]|uniref:septum formation inhibitor Maf n=1 Tax=Nitrosophilus kaiyonis TaxID=2930200 RepID=UPI002490B5EA|nr:septum formation inhibitor Maf [Nitrosophilus kaiyonis]